MISAAVRRSILRWIHIILSIPIAGYIYGQPAEVAQYAGGVRKIFFPAMVVTGLWMWRGHWVRRLVWKEAD